MTEQMLLSLLPSVPDAQRFVVELFLKSSVLVGGGILLVSAFRRWSAAERHLILAAVLIGQLALPWVSSLAPRVSLPIAWGDSTSVIDVASNYEQTIAASASRQPGAGANQPAQAGTESRSPIETSSPNRSSWAVLVFAIAYSVVAFGLLVHFGICAGRVSRRVSSLPLLQDANVAALSDRLRTELGISRQVALKVSHSGHSPWVWGMARPVVVLPAQFKEWSADYQRNALIHELAHIARNDLLAASVARICTTLFWVQPLSWFALKRMTRQAENACDDHVLLKGATDTAYAEQLLEVANDIYAATGLRKVRPFIPAMAGSSIVGKRIRSILEKRTRRSIVTKYTTTIAISTASAVIISLGSLTISKSQEASTSELSDAQLRAIAQAGPQSSDELEQLVTAYLFDGREAEAATAFADYIARPNAARPICELCSSLLPTDNTQRRTDANAALRSAFETLEERAYASQDGDLLFRVASVLIDSTDREAASRGAWYLFEALRLGNIEDVDDAKMLAVRALFQLGRLEAARAFVGEINDDPTSRYYQSESMRGWMAYLDQEIGRASTLSTLLMSMDEPQALQDQDYLPVYKRRPLYPQSAAELSKEGSVVVEFTVNDRGKTQDLHVVQSSDPVFERAAMEAAAQFLYMPKIVNGVAVNTTGVRNKITFEMGPGG